MTNSTICTKCIEGTFQDQKGQQSCEKCPIGSYCNRTGCHECLPCDYGHESVNEGSRACKECAPGHYKSEPGYELCKECAIGYFAVMAGAKYCTICPSGYYCPCTVCPPITCPSDSICPEGSVEFIVCSSPFYYVRNVEDRSCSRSFQFYLTICGSVVAFLILILTAFFSIRKQRQRNAATEAAKRLLSDTKNPLYHGY